MIIHILYKINKGPYGGGNQFLKSLRNYFISKNIYTENPETADVILFNSHHNYKELIKIKKQYPKKIFIHRIDGPVTLIRKKDKHTDHFIYKINNIIADASIFQSQWSQKKNYEFGIKNKKFETVILNAPDPIYFNQNSKIPFNKNRKTRLIASSWSHNLIKGFETYRWLDENLDFSKYEMTFCGNSPFNFKNIKHIKPLPSIELAKQLKKHDIFITASQNDPCSNSLIEALHCGLPAIVLNDGGHPEIIAKGGLTYKKNEEILKHLEAIKTDYLKFQENIKLPTMDKTGKKYFDFIKTVYSEIKIFKRLNLYNLLFLQKDIFIQKTIKYLKK